jgi:TonB-dependent receptor
MFDKKRLSTAIAMVAALSAVNTYAAEDEAVEEIVVSGIRESLSKAMDLKRNSNQVTDSIVAEDIGKLPDNNVAAALQRVTGVQITRAAGEASRVLIRGLPNVVTTLNGREVFTAAGRGIALADVPADLLQGVDVKKSASASDIEGGIAGSVDVRLRRPFDFDEGFTVAGGLRAEKALNADAVNPIGSVTINNNWDNFGVMLSLSSQEREFNDNARTFVTEQVARADTDILAGSVPKNIANQPASWPNVTGSIYELGDRKRTSENLAAQWRQSDNADYFAEFFHVEYEQASELNFWVPIPSWGPSIVTGYFPGTNAAQSLRKDFAPGTISSNQAHDGDSDTYQAAVGGKWTLDELVVKSDLAYTKSEATNKSFILDARFYAPITTYSFSKNGSGVADTQFFNADGTPYDLTKASNYIPDAYFDNSAFRKGDAIDWKTDFSYSLADSGFTSIDAGIRYSDRSAYQQQQDSGSITGGLKNKTIADFPGMASTTPDNLKKLAKLSTASWLTPSADYLRSHKDELRVYFGQAAGERAYNPAKFFDDQEKNTSAYVKGNFNFDEIGLKGEVGARVVKLQSILQGTSIQPDGSNSAIKSDTSSTDVLPSLNLRYALSDDLSLVGAASKTISRPNFDQLNPSTVYFMKSDTGIDRGDGGNPNLKNIESDNYDVSLEWYFGDSSSLTGGYFYRAIDGYISNASAYERRNSTDPVDYYVTRPVNGGDGSLKGIEIAYTQFFTDLPGAWSGLGVQLNGTHMTGDVLNTLTKKYEPITNVSENSLNAVLIYEYQGIGARLAYNWRDSYVENHTEPGVQPGKDLVFTPVSYLDLSLTYDLNDNLTLTADAVNLGESVIRNYRGTESGFNETTYTRDVGMTETTYSVGLRFKY